MLKEKKNDISEQCNFLLNLALASLTMQIWLDLALVILKIEFQYIPVIRWMFGVKLKVKQSCGIETKAEDRAYIHCAEM